MSGARDEELDANDVMLLPSFTKNAQCHYMSRLSVYSRQQVTSVVV